MYVSQYYQLHVNNFLIVKELKSIFLNLNMSKKMLEKLFRPSRIFSHEMAVIK